MAEYGSMFLVSGLAAILFFGGWHGPIPIASMAAQGLNSSLAGTGETIWLVDYLANLAGCLNFLLKGVVGVVVMVWVRWTLPRLRIDQVITTCLKYCVPIVAVCFLGALAWQMTPALGSPNDWNLMTGGTRRSQVREAWVISAERADMERASLDSAGEAEEEALGGEGQGDEGHVQGEGVVPAEATKNGDVAGVGGGAVKGGAG